MCARGARKSCKNSRTRNTGVFVAEKSRAFSAPNAPHDHKQRPDRRKRSAWTFQLTAHMFDKLCACVAHRFGVKLDAKSRGLRRNFHEKFTQFGAERMLSMKTMILHTFRAIKLSLCSFLKPYVRVALENFAKSHENPRVFCRKIARIFGEPLFWARL